MYELYQTPKRGISTIFNGFSLKPYAHKPIRGLVSVLEYTPLSRNFLYQPGRSDVDGENRLKSNVSSLFEETP